MNYYKIPYGIIAALSSILLIWGYYYQPETTLFLFILATFSIISFLKPQTGFFILLLLPIFGEFSRFEIFGRSIITSDALIPLFLISWYLAKPSVKYGQLIKKQSLSIAIFLIIAALSTLISLTSLGFSEVAAGSLYLFRLIGYLGLFYAGIELFPNNPQRLKLLKYLAIVSLLIVLGGFIQLQILPNLEQLAKTQGYDPHINRLVGSWLDPNFIGGFFAFIMSIYAGIALYEKNFRQQIMITIFLIILGGSLFLTYSRSAYLALITSFFIIGLLKSRRLLITLIILFTIGLSLSERAQERVSELTTSITSVLFNTAENPDPTARLRIQNWEQTLQLISQKPLFGQGYNNLTAVKLQEGFIKDADSHSASGSDSSLLTITATTGFLGLAAFIYFLYLCLKQNFINWRKGTSDLQKGLGLGLLAGLIGLLVHSNFVNSLLFPQIMIFLWPLIGLGAGFSKNSSQ